MDNTTHRSTTAAEINCANCAALLCELCSSTVRTVQLRWGLRTNPNRFLQWGLAGSGGPSAQRVKSMDRGCPICVFVTEEQPVREVDAPWHDDYGAELRLLRVIVSQDISQELVELPPHRRDPIIERAVSLDGKLCDPFVVRLFKFALCNACSSRCSPSQWTPCLSERPVPNPPGSFRDEQNAVKPTSRT
jgi:hypothetical protein